MTKPSMTATTEINGASDTLEQIKRAVAANLREDSRRNIENLIDKASASLVRACRLIADVRCDATATLDRL